MFNFPEKNKEITSGTSQLCSYGHCSMKGYRPSMEDRHTAMLDVTFTDGSKKGCFFGVYDGHGGDSVADYVSKTLPSTIYQGNLRDEDIKEAFVKVDSGIQENDTGTTCVIALVTKECDNTVNILCANSGDSRCILCQDDKVTELSFDQKPTNEEEKKRIVESGNIVLIGRVNGSLAVSRAFGDQRYKKSKDSKNDTLLAPGKQAVTVVPEIQHVSVHPNDNKYTFLVLACDGVWDVMKNPDLCKLVVSKLEEQEKRNGFNGTFDLGQICEQIVTKCIKELGSSDNCTLIISLIHPDPNSTNIKADHDSVATETSSSGTTLSSTTTTAAAAAAAATTTTTASKKQQQE
jgi:protein phosphatase 2C family protein 2/3